MDSTSWSGISGIPHVLSAATTGTATFAGADWVLLIVLIVALLFAATAAAAETALTSVNRIKVRNLAEEGDARAKRILRLLDQPQKFLSTILVVSNVSVIVASTTATLLAINLFANFGEVISTVVLSLIVLIFCEITPKTAAVQSPEAWARVLAGPVETLSNLLRWLIAALTWITNGIVRLLGGQTVRRGPFVTEEELRLLVEVGEEEGVLEEEEREMIHNVFELSDTAVREVMVPRIDMVTVEADATMDDAMSLIVQGGQSRIPVYDGSIDNIIGVLYAKDLLRIVASGQHPTAVRSLVRPAYFVPESKRLDDLLRELQQQRVHMAIVVDEYGAIAGLVTIEDLVEEIIGDIQDEYDKEEQIFERLSENEYIVDAKISLDDFNELLDTELTGEGYETLGGFVYTQLDKIPTVGDTVTFENLTITVLATKGRRVTKVKVVRHVEDADQSEDEGAGTSHTELPPPSLPPAPSDPPSVLSAPASDGQPYADESPETPAPSASPEEPPPSQQDESASADGRSRPLRTRSILTRRHGHGAAQPRRHM